MFDRLRNRLFQRGLPKPRPIDGLIQMIIYVYVPGKGYLATRRGITMCNLSGATGPGLSEEEMIVLEAKSGYRAITHRLAKFRAEGR